MDTDELPDLRAGRQNKLLFQAETEQIIGCSFNVLNELGHGLNEKIYENGLVVEFKIGQITFHQQRRFEVLYRGQFVGEFIPDLIAFGSIIVDTKVISAISEHERGQMINYLRITKLRVGLIINFKHPRLQWERLVL